MFPNREMFISLILDGLVLNGVLLEMLSKNLVHSCKTHCFWTYVYVPVQCRYTSIDYAFEYHFQFLIKL